MMGISSVSSVLTRWEIRPPDGSAPIRGDLRTPKGDAPGSAVVICHGFKGFRKWAFFPTLAREIAARGHAAITFDFSHNGVGAGESDLGDLESFAANTHSRNVDEIHMVLDALTRGKIIPARPARIGLFGHSRGGGEAILAACENGRLDALVTWSAISSVERWGERETETWERGDRVFVENKRTGQRLPINPDFWQDIVQNRERLDIVAAARGLRLPWLLVHGDADETVSIDNSLALRGAAGGKADFLAIAGGTHTFGSVHPFAGSTPQLQSAIEATVTWFDQHLTQHASAR